MDDRMNLHAPIPILRIFDEAKAKEHYLGFLGFKLDFEHRFGDNFPLFMQVSRDGCLLQLSEHHGDACPGASMHVQVTGLDEYIHSLVEKDYKYSKPGIVETPWGHRQTQIADPFGNKIVFFEPKGPE
jgi:uncharacterized glyoxalase superfamily protein PhnB